jgi:5-methylcytosine-specific restriction endonuclease McrA
MNINDIKLNEHNPRDITPEQFEKLKKSLQEFPEMLETRPLVIDEINSKMVKINGKRFIQCGICFEWFYGRKYCKNRTPKYCSRICNAQVKKMHIFCKLCNKEIENKHSAMMKTRIYCSKECRTKSRIGTTLSDEWKKALSNGRKNSNKCKGKNLYNWKGGEETIKERRFGYFYKRKKNLKKDPPILFLKILLNIQMNKCFYCEKKMINYKAIEHLTPVSKGGDNDIYNLVYCCKSCNSNKSTKTLEEYAIYLKKLYLIDKWDIVFSTAYSIYSKISKKLDPELVIKKNGLEI